MIIITSAARELLRVNERRFLSDGLAKKLDNGGSLLCRRAAHVSACMRSNYAV
jgi:hypothetical protein